MSCSTTASTIRWISRAGRSDEIIAVPMNRVGFVSGFGPLSAAPVLSSGVFLPSEAAELSIRSASETPGCRQCALAISGLTMRLSLSMTTWTLAALSIARPR